ncbi:hypothetical protein [Pseudoalteromonas luteoviolacea]|uniref:Uncharacterized protein n=1 Tax=Pseudoalteromonas luteoviolacea S4054 TaxID=1129367 RepID=A0A0F6AI08_9GAMM|nr:hypothetical protein [Pseudoalteromonas luteoviolacea]AOT07900.1 hypothetical protein S4054249_08620 [Pseudoalteromonas luteoviolacea]AOT12816.1 hypothetical protein S40542_08620 [Pseudoalteromonas luteoviolacea]AOT17729.1 hypothetical protein S4054_08615 [Pseudoalteromonas luteoviolacea]KKE85860.1 hypothetical protein N479_00370 [Pseudoalteromonas luteoviolacea S4054]KZN74738.1 hypothetical protein N481_08750 [Pseudoalteromonas luteoviolacea S4047-1]
MNKQYLKLITQGQDFGYITIRSEISGLFYGNGLVEQATEFELIPCSRDYSAFYYKIASSQKSYMDLSVASNVIKITQANNPEIEKVCAWKINQNNLHALVYGQTSIKALGRSTFKHNSNILYAAPPCNQDFSRLEVAMCDIPHCGSKQLSESL